MPDYPLCPYNQHISLYGVSRDIFAPFKAYRSNRPITAAVALADIGTEVSKSATIVRASIDNAAHMKGLKAIQQGYSPTSTNVSTMSTLKKISAQVFETIKEENDNQADDTQVSVT